MGIFIFLIHLAGVLKHRSFAVPPTQWISCRISQWHSWTDYASCAPGTTAHETTQGCVVCLRQSACLWFHKAGCHLAEYKYDISRSSGERTEKQCLSSETFPHVGTALPAWCILQCPLLKTEWSAPLHWCLCFLTGWKLNIFLINIICLKQISGIQSGYR